MSETMLNRLMLTGTVMLVAIAAYGVGFASGLSSERGAEALSDLFWPATSAGEDWARRESVRAYTRALAELRETRYAAASAFTPTADLPEQPRDFFVSDHIGAHRTSATRQLVDEWMAEVRHRDAPIGEVCAVALNREPAYLGGVPLPRAGEVRCSWDLATRLNRWRKR